MLNRLIVATTFVAASGASYAQNSDLEHKVEFLEKELALLKEQMKTNSPNYAPNVTTSVQNPENKQKERSITEVMQPKEVDKISQTSKNLMNDIQLYGTLRIDGAVDFGQTAAKSNGSLTSGKINVASFEKHGHRSDFGAAASQIGVHIKNLGGNAKNFGRFEGDFWTDGGRGDGKFRVRHAFINLNHWTLGQTTTLMNNLDTMTESVDYTLLLGAAYIRNPQVSYRFDVNEQFKTALGLEYSGERTSEWPSLTSRLSYKNENFAVTAQGFVNEKKGVNTDTKQEITKTSWGAGTGFKYKLSREQSIQAHYYHIYGDQRFLFYTIQNSTSDDVPLAGDFGVDKTNNKLLMNEYDSLSIGYSHRFNEKWRSNIAASVIRYDDHSDYAKNYPDMNRQLTDYVANLFYKPISTVDLGIEYHHGKRENFKNLEADIRRVNVSARLKF